MSVLVTGGAGFIGSHVVRELARRGEEVLLFDLAPHPPPGLSGSGARYYRGDIRDADALGKAMGSGPTAVDAVIHLAGLKSVAESMRNPGAVFDTNVSGSLALLRAVARAGVGGVVFSSSCSVYGDPDRLPVDEASEVRPANPYGESKAMVERMLDWFDRIEGIRHLTLRYFNAAGASDDAELGEQWEGAVNLVPVVMESVLGRGPAVRIFGVDYPTPDGTAIRDYIHVLDLADAHVRALDHLRERKPSEIINLGTGVGSSVREVIAAAAAVAGRDVPTKIAPRRDGDPAALWANSDRARHVLDWTAQRGLIEIVESAWRWHSQGDRARART